MSRWSFDKLPDSDLLGFVCVSCVLSSCFIPEFWSNVSDLSLACSCIMLASAFKRLPLKCSSFKSEIQYDDRTVWPNQSSAGSRLTSRKCTLNAERTLPQKFRSSHVSS
ncbi:uncharacterized protein [Bemisia tabaci]|uniref:uncharacterized protein n=1 Tax=Bemisia tabaci TaxID=7038 RepID=UPI003B280F68